MAAPKTNASSFNRLTGMLNTFKAQPGFIRYGLADTGEGTCVSISLWETHAEAEAAAPVAARRVQAVAVAPAAEQAARAARAADNPTAEPTQTIK